MLSTILPLLWREQALERVPRLRERPHVETSGMIRPRAVPAQQLLERRAHARRIVLPVAAPQ